MRLPNLMVIMLREVVNSFKLVKSIIRSLAFDMSACMHLPMTALLGNKIYLRGNFISLSMLFSSIVMPYVFSYVLYIAKRIHTTLTTELFHTDYFAHEI